MTEPGLVACYYIWPGNGVGLFLQPRSPHRAQRRHVHEIKDTWTMRVLQ